MEVVELNSLVIVNLTPEDSTFVTMITYDKFSMQMCVTLKYGERKYNNVSSQTFINFFTAESIGLFYNTNIKNMAKKQTEVAPAPVQQKNQPRRINQAKDDVRWIDFEIDVDKVNSAWIYKTPKGRRLLKCKLRMLPNGETDDYGRLGMITQAVPTEKYKEDKTLKGEILGNAEELVWGDATEEVEDSRSASLSNDISDDLPF